MVVIFIAQYAVVNHAYAQEHKDLIQAYQHVVEEARNSYEECTEAKWNNLEKTFDTLNLQYEVYEDELTGDEKSEIDRLKGQFKGYKSLREYGILKKDVKEKTQSLINSAEGFYAAVRYEDIDCGLMYQLINLNTLISNYAEMVSQVKDNFDDFDENDWKTYKKMYDCINYELYKRKNEITEKQKDTCRKLKAQYLSCYYEWKGKTFMDNLHKGLKKWERKGSELMDTL